MKTNSYLKEYGSVLIVTMMTITIMTLICATSLYISTQNSGSGMQTSGWQQALTGAESGIDAAIRALNQNSTSGANAWTNWKTCNFGSSSASNTPPAVEPTATATPSATALPNSSHYNYLPSSQLTLSFPSSEGATSVKAWVTIDTVGSTNLVSSGQQWYRIRSMGQTIYPANSTILTRVSNNRLDNDLRNTIATHFNRKVTSGSSSSTSVLGPTRTIEVIVNPIPSGSGIKGITLANWLVMSGGGTADAFSSPTGVWSLAYRDSTNPLLVAQGATGNNASFNTANQTYVYGGMVYSGNSPKNTSGNPPAVAGQVSTPDNISIPPSSNPTQVNPNNISWIYQNPWSGTTSNYAWTSNGGGGGSGTYPAAAGTYATLTGTGALPKNGNNTITSITANGTASSPALLIINSDFVVQGGKTFTINASTVTQNGVQVTDPTNSYITIWVQGKYTVSGSGILTQAAGTHVTWIVDGDITVSGSAGDGYVNSSGTASSNNFVGVGNIKVTDSGQAAFTGTIDAPLASGTLSGSGDYTGAILSSDLTISGSGSFHYDESLSGGGNSSIGNYAFASWFEDNSDPSRNALDNSGVNHPIVY